MLRWPKAREEILMSADLPAGMARGLPPRNSRVMATRLSVVTAPGPASVRLICESSPPTEMVTSALVVLVMRSVRSTAGGGGRAATPRPRAPLAASSWSRKALPDWAAGSVYVSLLTTRAAVRPCSFLGPAAGAGAGAAGVAGLGAAARRLLDITSRARERRLRAVFIRTPKLVAAGLD